jgi:hypothetical protein
MISTLPFRKEKLAKKHRILLCLGAFSINAILGLKYTLSEFNREISFNQVRVCFSFLVFGFRRNSYISILVFFYLGIEGWARRWVGRRSLAQATPWCLSRELCIILAFLTGLVPL